MCFIDEPTFKDFSGGIARLMQGFRKVPSCLEKVSPGDSLRGACRGGSFWACSTNGPRGARLTTAVVGGEQVERGRLRLQRWASLAVLITGSLAMVATSNSPNDTIDSTLDFSLDGLEEADGRLFVALNGPAASGDVSSPLEITVWAPIPKDARPAPGESAALLTTDSGEVIETKRGDAIGLEVSAPPGFVPYHLTWTPDSCSDACVLGATLEIAVADEEELAEQLLYAKAEIKYAGEDSVPDFSGLILGLGEGPDVLTSNTDETPFQSTFLPRRGVFLSSDHPETTQALELRIPREEIPIVHAQPGDSVDLVWKGGAMQVVPSDRDISGTVVMTPGKKEPLTIAIGLTPPEFEVPFTVECGVKLCLSTLDVSFSLEEGDWVVLDWSNYVPGLRTVEGDEWFNGWKLQLKQ